MKRVRFFEILCIVILAVFIFNITQSEVYSEMTAKQMLSEVKESFSVEKLKSIKKNKLLEEFSFDFDTIDSFSYYASDSIMIVDELLIIKLKQEVKPDECERIITERLEEKLNLFEGYAPNESALLENYVLKSKSGFVFYAVGEEAQAAVEKFMSVV